MEREHKISLLGSTGSIGTQTLEIVRENPEIKITALSANKNIELLEKQAREFKPRLVSVTDKERAETLKTRLSDTDIKVYSGEEGLVAAAEEESADTVLTAVVGISGLLPTIAAINARKNIALANKETLVCAGHIVTKLAEEKKVKLLPVDSEHSAIFQSLKGIEKHSEIKKLLLTASGGPFFGKTREELVNVTPKEALKHPNWDMGAKITIDSSTLVNKGLEVIEAKWLFDVDIDNIEVYVHRQSVIHSMVEFCDNAIIAQLGVPDMKLPIQYAITYPYRKPMTGNSLDFSEYPELTFKKPDTDTFFALPLAYRAGREGGILPTVFNSADEAAVELFLKEKISYLEITERIERAMDNAPKIKDGSLDDIFMADRFAREFVSKF